MANKVLHIRGKHLHFKARTVIGHGFSNFIKKVTNQSTDHVRGSGLSVNGLDMDKIRHPRFLGKRPNNIRLVL